MLPYSDNDTRCFVSWACLSASAIPSLCSTCSFLTHARLCVRLSEPCPSHGVPYPAAITAELLAFLMSSWYLSKAPPLLACLFVVESTHLRLASVHLANRQLSTLHATPTPNATSRRPRDRSPLLSCHRSCSGHSTHFVSEQIVLPSAKSKEWVVCDHSHLLAAEDQSLLHGWNALLLLDFLLYFLHFVVGFDVEFDFFAREGSDSVGEEELGLAGLVTWVGGDGWRRWAYLICMVGGFSRRKSWGLDSVVRRVDSQGQSLLLCRTNAPIKEMFA